MNEFDVFLRNCAKPLAYVRYGDDFIVFCRSKKEVARVKQLCLKKLDHLSLTINNKQDTTVRSWQGLHFLGHVIDKDGSTISKKTRSLMMERVSLQNISSYSSLKLSEEIKRVLPWHIKL